MFRPWAFWRQVQYAALVGAFFILLLVVGYFSFIHEPANCFDGSHNGDERGVDCGGSCELVCVFDVTQPEVQWAKAFRVTRGLYNAVAYVENRNLSVGTNKLSYTFTLYDDRGDTITTRSGVTSLPPDNIYPVFEGRIAVGDRVPVRTFLTLEPVEDWREMPDVKDQLVVENRELENVDSQPRLDALIRNTTLEDKRDVELIATIFDAEGNALTVSRSIVPLFEGRVQKQVVFTWPEPIAKTIRSCEVPTDVVMAIDLSGSMNDDGGTPPQPVTSVLSAAESFVNRLRMGDQVGVVTFATHADLVRGLTGDRSGTAAIIGDLVIDPASERGSTNIGDPIKFATDEFSSPRHSRDARKVLVLLTDGLANAPGKDAEAYALSAAAAAKAAGVTIFTIGLGDSVNQEFLSSLASEPDMRYLAPDTRSLDQIYRSISTALCEEGPAVIDIVPKVVGAPLGS